MCQKRVELAFCTMLMWIYLWSRLRGTTAGANNRMDLISLVTSGVNSSEASTSEEDILGVVEGWQDDETHNPDVPAVSHKRGMTSFVFVPFEEVQFCLICFLQKNWVIILKEPLASMSIKFQFLFALIFSNFNVVNFLCYILAWTPFSIQWVYSLNFCHFV